MALAIYHPLNDEYPERFQKEIELVNYPELISGMEISAVETIEFLSKIKEEKLHFRYAEDKWTIKEVWQHVNDTERVLSYRAMCYARKEIKTLPGFDEDAYALHSNSNKRSWHEIIDEFSKIRASSIALFKSMDIDMLSQIGYAGVSTVITTRAVGFLILAHEIHHKKIIFERYL